MKLINEITRLLEFSDLEDEVLDLADSIIVKYPKAEKEVDKVMSTTIDTENIRQESEADIKKAIKQLDKIFKKFSKRGK